MRKLKNTKEKRLNYLVYPEMSIGIEVVVFGSHFFWFVSGETSHFLLTSPAVFAAIFVALFLAFSVHLSFRWRRFCCAYLKETLVVENYFTYSLKIYKIWSIHFYCLAGFFFNLLIKLLHDCNLTTKNCFRGKRVKYHSFNLPMSRFLKWNLSPQ